MTSVEMVVEELAVTTYSTLTAVLTSMLSKISNIDYFN